MSLIKKYIEVRKTRDSYFRDYSAKERTYYKDSLIHLKHELDEIQQRIINNILLGTLKFKNVYSLLKKHNYHLFLDRSDKIQNYRTNKTITDTVGYHQDDRRKVFKEFEKMCHDAWEDYIITSDERKWLDDYCIEHRIDRTQQTIIEGKIAAHYSSDVNLFEAIEYYYIEDNRSNEEIQNILKKEYKKNIDIQRISVLTSEMRKSISNDSPSDNNDLLITLMFQDTRVYIVAMDQNLNSGYEFEITYIPGEKNNFKILVQRNHFLNINRDQQIELITDAICYKTSAQIEDSYASLKCFLEQKPLVRAGVETQF